MSASHPTTASNTAADAAAELAADVDAEAGIPDQGRAFSTEDYFNTQRPPASLKEKTEAMRAFVDKWNIDGKKVVLVTVSVCLHPCPRAAAPSHCPTAPLPSNASYASANPQSGGTTVPLESNT